MTYLHQPKQIFYESTRFQEPAEIPGQALQPCRKRRVVSSHRNELRSRIRGEGSSLVGDTLDTFVWWTAKMHRLCGFGELRLQEV
jgi:hypothetical protein